MELHNSRIHTKIRLNDLIDTIKRFDNIDHYIFIDADQYKRSCDINWIFKENIKVNYLILMTTALSGSVSKKLIYRDEIIHIESSSGYKDAADFCICSQISMLYLYLKMNDVTNISFTIVSGDHFASNIKAELETMNQSVYILQHKNRFDLFLISIMKEEQLSSEAIDVKRAIISKNYNINTIDLYDFNNEIERISDVNRMDDLNPKNITQFINLPFPKTLLSVKLIELRNYISVSFNDLKILISSKDVYLTTLGSLTDEHKKFFGVRSWFQLFITCRFILEKELNVFMIKTGGGYVAKYIINEQSTFLLPHDELRKYWLINWNESLIDFCLIHNIKVKDFSAWITGKSLTDSTCSTAIKKYILYSSS